MDELWPQDEVDTNPLQDIVFTALLQRQDATSPRDGWFWFAGEKRVDPGGPFDHLSLQYTEQFPEEKQTSD